MTRSPKIKRDCPFCGEAEFLRIHEGSIPRPIIDGSDTRKLPDGTEEIEEADAVGCDVCEAMAPLDVWNDGLSPESRAILRDFDPPSDQGEAT